MLPHIIFSTSVSIFFNGKKISFVLCFADTSYFGLGGLVVLVRRILLLLSPELGTSIAFFRHQLSNYKHPQTSPGSFIRGRLFLKPSHICLENTWLLKYRGKQTGNSAQLPRCPMFPGVLCFYLVWANTKRLYS